MVVAKKCFKDRYIVRLTVRQSVTLVVSVRNVTPLGVEERLYEHPSSIAIPA